MPLRAPLAYWRMVNGGWAKEATAESTVPTATRIGAATCAQRMRSRSRLRQTMPVTTSTATTVEADASHEGSALMLTPCRSGYSADVSNAQ